MGTFFSLNQLGVSTDPTSLMNQWLELMQTAFPGYTPSTGNLEYIQALIFASWAADVGTQATQGGDELFRQYGKKLVGVQPINGTSATALVTITAVDDIGYTLSAGAQFVLDELFGFVTFQDYTIPGGQTSIDVTLIATSPGTIYNGAGATDVILNQQLNWVDSVDVVSVANGGQDAESDEAYQQRLAAALQLMAPRPITATDYAQFATDFLPAPFTDQQTVGRATAIDGYDPGTNTYNNEREVTVCVTNATGSALNTDTINAVQSFLASHREANFIVNVVNPNYNPVWVQCSVARQAGYSAATVQQNVQTALENFLSPANWGLPPASSTSWQNTPTIYQSVIEATIQGAPGVDHIITGTLGMGFGQNPQGANDLPLAGPFPLPTTSQGATVPSTNFVVVN